jgi:RNA polymerase sigma factor (sigma-70 family)
LTLDQKPVENGSKSREFTMSTDGSITRLLRQLDESGVPSDRQRAQQAIWERFFQQLVVVARRKLGSSPRRVKDEEDVVISAMESFYAGAAQGRFPDLRDRDGLWPLLVMITARKAYNQVRDERAQKRGGGRVRGDSVWVGWGVDEEDAQLADFAFDDKPTPEMAAELSEECSRLLNLLPDDSMRRIAELKLQGSTTHEIATQLGISPRTLERRLQSIRQIWADEGLDDRSNPRAILENG